MRGLILLTILSIAAVATVAQNGDVKTVGAVDLDRYAGRWFEIARYPNKFQKQCVGNVTATYTRKSDGRIEVLNECVKKDGIVDSAKGEAKLVDKNSNAKLKVRFAPKFLSGLGFVWGDYWIIDLGPKYEYAVVGDPDRDYLWVLAREKELSDGVYQDILRRLEAQGFQPAKLVKTSQNVETLKGAAIERS